MKTGYHAVYAANFFDGIDDALKYGFDFVQFDLGVPTYFINGLSDHKLAEIRKYAQSRGVEISFHAPGDNVSLFCVRVFSTGSKRCLKRRILSVRGI